MTELRTGFMMDIRPSKGQADKPQTDPAGWVVELVTQAAEGFRSRYGVWPVSVQVKNAAGQDEVTVGDTAILIEQSAVIPYPTYALASGAVTQQQEINSDGATHSEP